MNSVNIECQQHQLSLHDLIEKYFLISAHSPLEYMSNFKQNLLNIFFSALDILSNKSLYSERRICFRRRDKIKLQLLYLLFKTMLYYCKLILRRHFDTLLHFDVIASASAKIEYKNHAGNSSRSYLIS